MQTVQQLQMIAALTAHRHFGRAAQALGISQPALTKAVRGMEKRFGAPLFDRGPPVTPTSFGALVAAHGHTILAEFDALKREIGLAKGLDTGRLVVAAGGQVAEFSAIDAVAALSLKHPFISVDLRIADHVSVTDDVREGRASVGIAHLGEAERHDDLDCRLLRRSSYVLFCAAAHPLAGAGEVPPDALLDYPWIGGSTFMPALPGYDGGRRAFGEVIDKTGAVRLRLRTPGFQHTLRILETSHAISAAPEIILRPHIQAGRIAVLRSAFNWPDLAYGVITRKGRTPAPATIAFLAEVDRIEAALGA